MPRSTATANQVPHNRLAAFVPTSNPPPPRPNRALAFRRCRRYFLRPPGVSGLGAMLVRALVAVRTANERRRLERLLSPSGILVLHARDKRGLSIELERADVDLVICGSALLSQPPEPLITSIRELPEHPEIIVISVHEDAVERAALLAAGCMAVLHEDLPDLSMGEALHALVARRREALIRDRRVGLCECEGGRLADFVSDSAPMRELMTVVRRVVDSHSPLLVLGETGVGKERLARAIHAEGPRSAGPFVAVNCGALPEGLLEAELFGHEQGAFTGATRSRRGFFELAHGGTLFLDEIGEIPFHLQVKLLRALEERTVRRVGSERSVPVNLRVIAATNRHLESEVAAKQFRADLYYRLAVVTLVVPPLRERCEDIPPLVRRYVEHFGIQVRRSVTRVAPAVMERLRAYSWPGNVRELMNVVERAVLLATTDTITLSELPSNLAQLPPCLAPRSGTCALDEASRLPSPLCDMPLRLARRHAGAAFERAYLSELLGRTKGRVSQTARMAGVDVRTVHGLMKKHGLRKEAFRVRQPPTRAPGSPLSASRGTEDPASRPSIRN